MVSLICVVITVAGSTTVKPANWASCFLLSGIQTAGKPKVGSVVLIPSNSCSVVPGFIASIRPIIIESLATSTPFITTEYSLDLSCKLSRICKGGTIKPISNANCLRMDLILSKSSPLRSASTKGISS